MGKVKTLSPTTAHKIGSMINGCKANIQPVKLAPAVERVNRVQYFEVSFLTSRGEEQNEHI